MSATSSGGGGYGFSLVFSRTATSSCGAPYGERPRRSSRSGSSSSATSPPDGLIDGGHRANRAVTAWPCAGRSSAADQRATTSAASASASCVYSTRWMPAQEGLHGQPAGVPGAAAGGQHVVGAGAVVAQRHRRPRPDEDRAGVAHPQRDLAGVRGLDLQVLGGVGVDHRDAVVEVVDQHRAGLRPGQRGGDPLGVLGRRDLAVELRVDRVGQLGGVVTSTEAAFGSCSAWLIRSAATCTGSAVSSASTAISVVPASASIPTSPRTSRFAAVT